MTVRSGSRLVRAAEQWWEESSYLEDVALVFAVITVVNSGMMVAGWDTPKTGTFAYTHLLSRLAIVAAVVTLFHLDDLQKHIKRRFRDRRRLPTTDRDGREPAVELLLRQFPRAPLGRAAAAFTVVTAVLCLVAITSSVFWEPRGGVVLYRALLVLAAILAVLVGSWTWWHRSRKAPPPHLPCGVNILSRFPPEEQDG